MGHVEGSHAVPREPLDTLLSHPCKHCPLGLCSLVLTAPLADLGPCPSPGGCTLRLCGSYRPEALSWAALAKLVVTFANGWGQPVWE